MPESFVKVEGQIFLVCVLTLSVFSILLRAQNKITEPAPPPTKFMQCSTELFDTAEHFYRLRKFRSNSYRAENSLKKILEVCPNAHLISEIQRRLNILAEEKADNSLRLAVFYLEQAQKPENKLRGLKGSQSRLLEIIEKFPNYSKLDKVVFLTGETYFLENENDEAQRFFRKLIDEYSTSEYSSQAKLKLQIIEQKKKAP